MMQNTLFRPSVMRESRRKFNPEGFDLAAAIEARKAEEAKPVVETIEIPAAESHRTAAFKTQPIELITPDDADLVIRAAYRQVFGNAHLMESEKCPEAESQLRSGEITVLEFIRQLAQSERYQTLFLDRVPNLRTVELNFKHLLGRAPADHDEISRHIQILVEDGFAAEIDSYLDSDEYFQAFGSNIVPYYRGFDSQPEQTVTGFTHSYELFRGISSSDKSIQTPNAPVFKAALLTNDATPIRQLSSSAEFLEAYRKPKQAELDPTAMGLPLDNREFKTSEFLATPRVENWLQEYKGREAAATFPAARRSQPVRLADASGDTADLVIRAAYKQVFGNVHLMESQRLLAAESKLKDGQLSVREFIRALAQSETYQALFFEPCSNIRAVELNFKHLLGRAPDSNDEVAAHLAILAEGGFSAEIDSYIDSAEYEKNFGQLTVPYYVSYATQTGKNVAGYNRIFKLVRGECSSDRTISDTVSSSQKAQLQTDLLTSIQVSVPPTFNPKGFDLSGEIYNRNNPGKPRPPAISDTYFNALSDRPKVEFIPGSTQDIEQVINAAYQQVFGNAHLMESERSPQIESQLRSGEITVLEFIRQLAQSDQYRARFFEPYSNVRAIELNFKHLLGRAPDGYAEISKHIAILATDGFQAEIDSYLDSDEYFQAFGANTVPYYRGFESQVGQNLAGFTHAFQLLRGTSGSDKSTLEDISSELSANLMGDRTQAIEPLSTADPSLLASEREIEMAKAPAGKDISTLRSYQVKPTAFIPNHPINVFRRNTVAGPEALSDGQRSSWESQARKQANTDPVMLTGDRSAEKIELVIQAVYKQVLGNAHVMESERLTSAESLLKNGTFSVRDFVRAVAKSDLYRSRFIDSSPRYRTHELNFKHLLGRAPDSYAETIAHSNLLDTQGYEADIDSYLDSDEYQDAFGDYVVPYARGYNTQTGTGLLGYTSMFEMRDSVSTSDQALIRSNTNRSPRPLFPARPAHSEPTDTTDLVRRVLNLI